MHLTFSYFTKMQDSKKQKDFRLRGVNFWKNLTGVNYLLGGFSGLEVNPIVSDEQMRKS